MHLIEEYSLCKLLFKLLHKVSTFDSGISSFYCTFLNLCLLFIDNMHVNSGNPKGILRDTGGHATALKWTMSKFYNTNMGETFWAASDIGWVVGKFS